ncbi:MAG: 3-hydroxyacyl-CoA dehydrogenase NAD-binding domain-containing protein [Syntrophomonadaceae bacterium]
MKVIGVLGAGIMGSGIAQVMAEVGYQVIVNDISDQMLDKATKDMQKNWQKAVDKQKITAEQMTEYLNKVVFSSTITSLKDADMVIEAVAENMALKQSIMAQLDEICDSKTIFASNTSTLPVAEIACATKRPEQVVGMHFFNPVPLMKLVEIVQATATADSTVEAVKQVVINVKKVPVVAKDTPGFIVNRVLTPAIMEAMTAFGDGVASAADIDTAMKLGVNWPIGPLALADMIGLDTLLSGSETFVREFTDQKYRPPHVLRQMVRANRLGMKTGKGFYDYGK